VVEAFVAKKLVVDANVDVEKVDARYVEVP
jgi:hypothetical protein